MDGRKGETCRSVGGCASQFSVLQGYKDAVVVDSSLCHPAVFHLPCPLLSPITSRGRRWLSQSIQIWRADRMTYSGSEDRQ